MLYRIGVGLGKGGIQWSRAELGERYAEVLAEGEGEALVFRVHYYYNL